MVKLMCNVIVGVQEMKNQNFQVTHLAKLPSYLLVRN